MKKILIILICGVLVIGVTGCGNDKLNNDNNSNKSTSNNKQEISNNKEDNQNLVDTLNNYISEKKVEWEKEGRASYISISHIQDDYKNEYTFLTLCKEEFKEKPNITEWTYDAESISNYDGYCMYSTVELQHERNKDRKLHTVVIENSSNNYYDVYITFKTFKLGNTTYTYPIFSNSKLLK